MGKEKEKCICGNCYRVGSMGCPRADAEQALLDLSKKQKKLCLELCNSEIRLSNYKVSSEAQLKEKASVEKLEKMIKEEHVGFYEVCEGYELSVSEKEYIETLATALNKYITERE